MKEEKKVPRISKNSEYEDNGVVVTPSVPAIGKKTKVIYDGLLAKSGADDVYARIGFGSDWEYTLELEMSKISDDSFETSFTVPVNKPLNVCFRDGLNNWDNNSGSNYTFDVK